MRIRRYLVAVLAVATVATLMSTYFIYRNALAAAEESLKLQASGIAASLEPSIPHRVKRGENPFSSIVADSSWPGIAFIALYDTDGNTILHSNEVLIGRKIESAELARAAASAAPVTHHQTLGTGEDVFMLDYPFVSAAEQRVLRIALHPWPAQRIIQNAIPQAISIIFVVAGLWVLGFFFLRALGRAGQLQARIAERERFAVIGEMAAVLAHEIRNPLGSIKGYAQYLSEKQPEGSGDADSLALIVTEARRLERLTEDLLLYARPLELRVTQFSIAEAATEAAALVCDNASAAGRSISVSNTISPEITMISDREKLKQVLVNVLQNAADAVADGGIIRVTGCAEGPLVEIEVSDNGCGMDAETRSRAFNTFFTTKAKGTGLGLAIVSRLAGALGGSAEIDSEAGKGTTVHIVLPRAIRRGEHE